MAHQHINDDAIAETDEPPDERCVMTAPQSIIPPSDFCKSKPAPLIRKHSLLTQGLTFTDARLHQIDVTPLARGLSTASNRSVTSAASTADLTSDGHTSPDRANTPSPPLPPVMQSALRPIVGDVKLGNMDEKSFAQAPVVVASPQTKDEATFEAGLGRRRCIRFACGRDATPAQSPTPTPAKVEEPPPPKKTPCMLRFVCPSRASQEVHAAPERKPKQRAPSPAPAKTITPSPPQTIHYDSQATITQTVTQPKTDLLHTSFKVKSSQMEPLPLRSFDSGSDLGGFNEFAIPHGEGDQWTNEATCHRSKMTVQDLLVKEAKYRRLGEEAEQEALQDEEDLDDEDDVDDEDRDEEDESDDGNESDNEEGFADSDCESDGGSENAFWTPAHAAAPASHYEPIKTSVGQQQLASSLSSLEFGQNNQPSAPVPHLSRKSSRPRKIRSEAPELPDSTDFVCGTLDEDRPLEAAYLSCMEERRKSKHVAIPQDIDPSFPTSDPEDNDNDSDDAGDHPIIGGQMDDDTILKREPIERRGRGASISKRSPAQSPRPTRLHRSPPPPRHHNPSPRRMRSPPPTKRLKSPPRPRRQLSIDVSPKNQAPGINYAPLHKRPGLTHTASLPRSPAPFHRSLCTKSTLSKVYGASDDTATALAHRRGAVDIVKGLENKQQRRRDKLAQKCQHRAAKEKPRRPLPGKGAERMREVGEQKAGRTKLQAAAPAQAKYVLSV
ncbi:MAG: hypothetical protein M1814_006356 [Vezdaea aestivalis]|nr:MAG: hypothetical protein M1814_006356 [Vezdaea aestivalis]